MSWRLPPAAAVALLATTLALSAFVMRGRDESPRGPARASASTAADAGADEIEPEYATLDARLTLDAKELARFEAQHASAAPAPATQTSTPPAAQPAGQAAAQPAAPAAPAQDAAPASA
ncbi:MAG: hypothetical protein HZA53_16775, partial [Planctomycetes bacterium]|nr:hypothetical protein [Planctomycetota bacterium]